MDVGQNKMRSRVSSLQEQAVENIDTANGYFEEESDELKELGNARAINFIKKRKILVISFLLIAAIGYGVYGKYFNLTDAEIAQKELAIAVSAVGELMILPEGDEPVLATVTDAETLIKQQAFFTGAMDGDQLLLFPKNMKAVIYSPSRNKIINAGPIEQQAQAAAAKSDPPAGGLNPKSEINSNIQNLNVQNEAVQNSIPSVQESAAVNAPLTVEVRNGTNKTGYAATVAGQIQANKGYAVVKVGDAENKNYKKTVVMSRASGEAKSQLVSALASMLSTNVVSDPPSSEKNTEADVLVILGE